MVNVEGMFKVGDIVRPVTRNDDILEEIVEAKIVDISEYEGIIIIKVLEATNPRLLNQIVNIYTDLDILEVIDNESNVDEDELNIECIKYFINKHKNEEIESYKNRLSRLIREKESVRERLVDIIKDIEKYRAMISSLKIDDLYTNQSIQKVMDELKLIRKDNKCEKISINKRSIDIFTKQLYIEDENYPEGHFKINKYKISIYLNDLSIRIYGLLDKYNRRSWWSDECPHPHISHRGEVCWGNTEAMIVDALESKELYTAFLVVINFLETFNIEDGAGKNIVNWDYVSKEDDNKILENPYSIVKDCEDDCLYNHDNRYDEGFEEMNADDIPF